MKQLVIADFKSGLQTDVQPFLVNNDAFPVLNNAYVWRGRVLKKRGNSFLGRPYLTITGNLHVIPADGIWTGNILNELGLSSLTTATVVPGSVSIVAGAITFKDNQSPFPVDGFLHPFGHIYYKNGDAVFGDPTLNGVVPVATIKYYLNLPIMGLEDFFRTSSGSFAVRGFPEMIVFDTRNVYSTNGGAFPIFAEINAYKVSGAGFINHGTDYQQFWTTNYQTAMWATNNNPGFHKRDILSMPVVGAISTFETTVAHTFQPGDYVFIYEVAGVTNVNGVSGAIIATPTPTTFTLATPGAAGAATGNTGIAQSLTRSISSTGDGIRWFDGNPTSTATGWVNFSPPLDNAGMTGGKSQYLIGARMIVPFKNRLLFFGPVIATSALPGGQLFPNRVVYSQVGIPYYASPLPIAFPSNTVPDPAAFWSNVAGRGGFLDAPIPDAVVTVEPNLDVLICGFESRPFRLVFTGDDSLPFIYQTISTEYGSESTFSAVNLDTGILTIADYGINMTDQVSAQRIDLQIPDQVFDISTANNGLERVTAIRDYRNEFIYFSYPPKEFAFVSGSPGSGKLFPNRTLLYNYRNQTWATFKENFTKYGTYRISQGLTWATIGAAYNFRWDSWDKPWSFGGNAQEFPNIVGGNQQGFIMIKGDGVQEGSSQSIKEITFDVNGDCVIESTNHCLDSGDFILIRNAYGMLNMEGEIFLINVVNADTFKLVLNDEQTEEPPAFGTLGYLGGGVYSILTNLQIITKQFPIFWGDRNKVRVGTQRYLFNNAPGGQVTVNVFVSQRDIKSNPSLNTTYPAFTSTVLTSSEPEQVDQESQDVIWHRVSTSFIGDSVQFEITLSPEQMQNQEIVNADIVLNAIALELYPGPILS